MGLFSRLFGGSQGTPSPPTPEPPLRPSPVARLAPAPAPKPPPTPTGIQMDPAPWTFTGLPPGLTLQDFNDAATVLASQTRVGRIIPLPVMRSRSLSGTGYDANLSRIRTALTYPSLQLPAFTDQRAEVLGHIVAAILWRDSSLADGTRPVALIGPSGYFGSVYHYELSQQLHNFTRTEAQRFQLLAAAIEINPMPDPIGSHSVRVWLPTDDEEVERFRRWLRGCRHPSAPT